jgi:predicted RNase H-like nuclease (RuvC/YqgF family)
MQTLSVQVQDNYIQNFMSYVNEHNADINVLKDKNLELDPYFYERKKKLHQIRDDVHSGKMGLLTQEESDDEIELFFKELENNQ